MIFRKILFLLMTFCFFVVSEVLAIESENYKIDADVFSVGGLESSSESYILKDTLGEPLIGIGTSESYKSKAGFWHMVATSLSISVDSQTVDLGETQPTTPQTGESTVTVTTDSWNGYDLLINQNHSLTHTDTITTISDYSCSIASPCSWTGYGLGFTVKSGTNVEAKWGTSPSYNYAAFPNTATVFHEKSDFSSGGDNTVVEYKAQVDFFQKSGNYSNLITYTAMANL